MADDRQMRFAFPEQQENKKNTKIEKISWEFFKTSSCNEKEKSQK